MKTEAQVLVEEFIKNCKTLGIEPQNYCHETRSVFYRKARKAAHPDTGGDSEKFIAVNIAYEWLNINAEEAMKYLSKIDYSDKAIIEAYHDGWDDCERECQIYIDKITNDYQEVILSKDRTIDFIKKELQALQEYVEWRRNQKGIFRSLFDRFFM